MKLADIKDRRQKLDLGTLVSDIPVAGFEGVRLRVRPLRNNDYIRLESKMLLAIRGRQRGTAEQLGAIDDACLKQTVLIGWEGIDDPFTPEAVDGIFADPDIGPAFREAIRWCAQSAASEGAAALEADAKN